MCSNSAYQANAISYGQVLFMYVSSLTVILFYGFVSGFLPTWLGLLLVNLKPDMKRLCLVGLSYALLSLIIKASNLPTAGLHLIILTIFLIAINMVVWQLGVLKSCFITIIGTFALLLGEAILFPIFSSLGGLEPEVVFDSPKLSFLLGLPQTLFNLFLIALCSRFRLHLLDFSESQPRGPSALSRPRGKKVLLLSVALFAIVLVQTWWITIVLNVLPYKKLSSLPLQTMGLISYGVIVSAVIAVGFITKQMIDLAQKESQYEVQAEYINTLDDLFTSVRAQRHDLVNHLQTLSGFIQLGDPSAAQEYLQELLGETLFTPEVIIQGAPGLSALLYIKQGKAAADSIEFRLNISGELTDINVPPYELNRIIGNIINNAFDHVQALDVDQRLVQVDIVQNETGHCFRIANSGTLNQESRAHIFDRGFSTKEDNQHSGLGLFIVKSLVQKHNGSIVVDNSDDMVTFTVFFPRKNTTFKQVGTVLDLHK